MNRVEAAKLVELIKLAYPYAYRDLDEEHLLATVRMWAASFREIPYPLVEQCLEAYRMTNRYAPTVADINRELQTLRRDAETAMLIQRQLGNKTLESHFAGIYTAIQPQTKTPETHWVPGEGDGIRCRSLHWGSSS